MATSADRASRLRQALQTLLDDGQRQVDTWFPLRQLVKGSVYDLCHNETRRWKRDDGDEMMRAFPHAAPVVYRWKYRMDEVFIV